MPCQALVRMLAKKPGWKETNFQVVHYFSVTSRPFFLVGSTAYVIKAFGEYMMLGLGLRGLFQPEKLCMLTIPSTMIYDYSCICSQHKL